MADVHVQPTRKRRRTETTEISTETYNVTDYRPTQDELMAVDDFMILNNIIVYPTDDRNCTVKTDDGQITTHDRIRQMMDRNYKKSVENTMRKYNKKVSKSNSKIEKGSFVTVKIPIVDRASGDLPCEFGVLNACYDMGEIELLTRKVETSHWKKEEISLHAAAKQARFSLASKRCKCKGTYMR